MCYVKHPLTPFLSLLPPCAHPVTACHTCAQGVDQAVVMEGMLMCRLVQAAKSCFSGKPAGSLPYICAICWEILLSFLVLETCLLGYIFGQKIQRNSNLLSIFSALNIGLRPFICWSRGMEKSSVTSTPLHAPSYSFLSLYYQCYTHSSLLYL